MKRKNLISGLLAGALVLTSVFVPGVKKTANAQEYDLAQGLVAEFTFDNEDLKDEKGGADADAIVTGLNLYQGTVKYIDGQKGKALQLGDYGLRLNRKNLGKNFTVSLWLKPDGNIMADQSTLFLGYNAPEKWLAVAGDKDNSTQYRFWGNGNGLSWTGMGTTDIASGSWHQLTLTGSESGVKAYLDGTEWGSGNSNSPLTDKNQDIYVGVTYWDDEFTGAVDEVKVYNRTLSEGEVYRLYDDTTSAEELLDQGIEVTSSMNMVVGREEKINISMHPVAADADPQITYRSDDESVAAVSGDGTVTAVGSGTTQITTTVKIGSVVKTGKTEITVSGKLDDRLVGSFDFEDSLDNSAGKKGSASALVSKLSAYTGEVKYEAGKHGKAVHLDDYGLKLNLNNVGDEYTVSMWVKSDAPLIENQCVLFLGYHNPENWISLSGNAYESDTAKLWANGGGYGWTTFTNCVVAHDEWHQITITGTADSTVFYLDGISLGTFGSNSPLKGENADIYLGVNNWDEEYKGLVDDVKVYNIALSEKEVQDQATDEFASGLQNKLDNAVEQEDLLGENKKADEIRYDLELPETADGLKVVWTSSDPDVISDDGKVICPSEKTDVILTGAVNYGQLSAEVRFTYTVLPLDREKLDELIEEAESIDPEVLTEVSAERLAKAIEGAKAADSFSTLEKAMAELQLTLDNLNYLDEAVNPFAHIADPVTMIQLKEGETQELFELPENVADYVTVKYVSENEDVAVYSDGKIAASGAGKTIVTAEVTSKYDGFTVNYSTAVCVTAEEKPVSGKIINTTDPSENFGNADLMGDIASIGNAVLSEEEKEEVAGGSDARIKLKVNDITAAVSEEDRTLAESVKEDAEIGLYLDIDLLKQIGSADVIDTDYIEGTVTIAMSVPENLKNTDEAAERTYQLINIFNGEASTLNCSYDANTGVLTFSADKFGTYALAYSDKETEQPGEQPGDLPDGDDQTPSDEEKPLNTDKGNDSVQADKDSADTVQTGDTANVFPIAAACIITFALAGGTFALKIRRRK